MLARQYNLKIARNFADQPFPKELLDLVPEHLASEKMVFPLKLHENVLAIAIHDPFDSETFDAFSRNTGMKIYPVLASFDWS